MDYYLKPSQIIFSWRTFLFLITLLDFFLILGDINHTHNYVRLALLFLTAVLWIFPIARLLFVWLQKTPVLTVNNVFIYDHLSDRKYYWEDVEDALAEEDYLRITLNENPKHPIRPYNNVNRFMLKIFSRKPKKMTSFYIYIYVLDVIRDEFLETLNNLSIAAENKS